MDSLQSSLEKALPPSALLKTCKRCHQQFDPRNTERTCRYHPHAFAGETAQRWLPPGENHGEGSKVVYHWWCCSSTNRDEPGCEVTTHEGYD